MFSIILPIITTPYISRILGANGIGENAYSLSIAQLFVVFGLLGTIRYGNKEIARNRNNEEDIQSTFMNIYINQLFTGIIALILYFVFINVFVAFNSPLYYIQSIYIAASLFDISWYFQGKEDFGKTVLRGISSKILGAILIFLFVKEAHQINLYAFILAVSNFLSIFFMWILLVKEMKVKKKNIFKINFSELIYHFKNNIVMFIPIMGIQLSSLSYQVILGITSGSTEVGYFSNAVRIITIPMYIITSLGTVMLPRMSYEIKQMNSSKVNSYLEISLNAMLFLAIPLTFGIIAISENFIQWFLGPGFEKVAILISILSLRVVPTTIIEFFSFQYLIPNNKNKEYTISISIGAVVCVVLNFIISIWLQSVGTSITLVVSELIVMICILLFSKEKIKLFKNIDILKYCILSLSMFLLIISMNNLDINSILLTFIQMLVGLLFYLIGCYLLKCKIFDISFLKRVRQ